MGSENNPKICVEAFLESKLQVSVQIFFFFIIKFDFTCNPNLLITKFNMKNLL